MTLTADGKSRNAHARSSAGLLVPALFLAGAAALAVIQVRGHRPVPQEACCRPR